MSRRLLAPEAAASWSVPAAPTGAGLFTNTAGLQKLADIIQVGPGRHGSGVLPFPALVTRPRLGAGLRPAPPASEPQPLRLPSRGQRAKAF